MPPVHVNIVGAGIIGLSIAFELSSRGHTLTIIDPAPGQGATHAAAGMLAPAAETVWGQGPLHQLLATSNSLYPQFVDRIASITGHRPDYLQSSTLVVAAEAADREALHELIELQNSIGLATEKLLPSQARSLEPALASNIAGAVLCPDDHQIDPRSVVRILLEYFQENLVYERVEEVITDHPNTSAVRTSSGQLHAADQTIIATALGVVGGVQKPPLRPVYGDILRIQAPAGPALLNRIVRGIVHRQHVYLVPRKDRSLVLGASVREDHNPEVHVGAMYNLLDNARRLVPGISDCLLNEVIARARPATADDRPLIGRINPNVVLSTGYSRHGVLLSPLGSALTADLTENITTNPMLNDVDPQRFSTLSSPLPMEQHQ
ncbi:glycine oxidase ThiO [Arthrobacter sp. NIO-1057]|uniref:glycine oxidase ThiO n=1 Tax=Arthrobacter sp. NIO-1057 TaxID=993071 RepID=UPI00081813E5|nr:glycine oxidase ThiO [Arthrobacter sp. NIO-1057]SCB96695.1 glycine oxidase [Arthrobacter sp. NIO-1057]